MLSLLLAVALAQVPYSARVVGVGDGDSITVLAEGNRRIAVRLDGIDAPELHQDFGRRAKEFTSDLLFDRDVEVRPKTLDRYRRKAARVIVGGQDASVEIVRAGYAWHFLKYSSDPLLDAAERSAREARRGLWQRAAPVPPWDFRAGRAPVPDDAAAFRGNRSTRVFHRAGCPNYACQKCTAAFASRAAALAAGYRPARCCSQ